MSETYMSLLQQLYLKGKIKEDIAFVDYLMYKYNSVDAYFKEINKAYLIKEDLEDLEDLLAYIREDE